eukprot:TRINITY_DN46722_c0_g1_i1.p1 TRINITY_DN46722_c0_g1~~TRINITY_DN46722_c0_g1_i1.p1  ORF type:complete len:117 (+),score=30.91 TRINITY_DN46722_c0_g1_i1:132-482(+)
MWMMLQCKDAEDWVLATGEQFSVRHFCELCFGKLGYQVAWRGEGINEEGYDKTTGKVLIKIDERYFRPAEVETLLGDPTKIKTKLGWKPRHTFEDLVDDMIKSETTAIDTGSDNWA